MNQLDTEVLEKTIEETDNLKSNSITLFNDHVNTFDDVIEALVKICNHELLQAEQCTYLVHYKGKCIVKEGNYDDLLKMYNHLSDKGLTVELN